MTDILLSALFLIAWMILVWLVCSATIAPGHLVIVWRWAKKAVSRVRASLKTARTKQKAGREVV
jgi:hypothetical protein